MEQERTHLAIPIVILTGGILIIPYLATHFFNNRLHAIFGLFIVFSLISYTYFVAYWDIYSVLRGEKQTPKLCEQVNIKFDKGIKPLCGSSVIGATESHIFIFNQDDTTTVVFPRLYVEQDVFNSPLFEDGVVNQFFRLLNISGPKKETQDEQ